MYVITNVQYFYLYAMQYFWLKWNRIWMLSNSPLCFRFSLTNSFDLKCWMVLTLNLRKIGFLKRATLTSDQSMGSSMKPNLKMEWGSFCYVKSNMYVGHMNHPLVIFKRSSHPKALLERFGLKSKICTPPRDCRGMARLNDVFSFGNSSNLSFFGPWNLVDEPRCEFLSHIILASFKFKDFFFEKAFYVLLIIQNAKKCYKSYSVPTTFASFLEVRLGYFKNLISHSAHLDL